MLARLVLDDGQIFKGKVFSKGKDCFAELIFNTAMTGYEEVLTDPSYKGQMVLMTYPLIGNYGINKQDMQSKTIHLEALLVKEYINFPSHYASQYSLKEYLEKHDVFGIQGIDTRLITRTLRHRGAMNAYLTTSTESDEDLVKKCKAFKGIENENLVSKVSTKAAYEWKALEKPTFNVAVIDCGLKQGILNQLNNVGCKSTVFPYNVSSDTILNGNFDGIMFSNGPGNPENVTETLDLLKNVLGKRPIFGICLGHQMLSLVAGYKLEKLPFGHHGVNHPIKNLFTNNVEITSQNHIYCTQSNQVVDYFNISHTNLNDNTVAGIKSDKLMAFSVQYHPESSPGPYDSHYLFKEFTYLMKNKAFNMLSDDYIKNKKGVFHAETK